VHVSVGEGAQIDVWVFGYVIRVVRTHFEQHGIFARPILKMMAIRVSRPKSCAITSSQHFLARVRHHNHLALHHDDELVVVVMPMPLARPLASRENKLVDAELSKTRGLAQTKAIPRSTRRIVGSGITGAHSFRCVFDIDLLHAFLISSAIVMAHFDDARPDKNRAIANL